MSKIKVYPGDKKSHTMPKPNVAIMTAGLMDYETGKEIDTINFVSIWASYKKDQALPQKKQRKRVRNKIQKKDRKGNLISVTLKINQTKFGKEIEKAESALRRLLAKDGRYEIVTEQEALEAYERCGSKNE